MGKLIDDTSILEHVPDDVIGDILSDMKCSEIHEICKISKRLNKFCGSNIGKATMRRKIEYETRLDPQLFNSNQLLRNCKYPIKNRMTSSEHGKLMINCMVGV